MHSRKLMYYYYYYYTYCVTWWSIKKYFGKSNIESRFWWKKIIYRQWIYWPKKIFSAKIISHRNNLAHKLFFENLPSVYFFIQTFLLSLVKKGGHDCQKYSWVLTVGDGVLNYHLVKITVSTHVRYQQHVPCLDRGKYKEFLHFFNQSWIQIFHVNQASKGSCQVQGGVSQNYLLE